MNVGGVIEQLASPDELMRAPANDFVRSFVGEDRGLRRLALNSVSALRFHQRPVVAAAFDFEFMGGSMGSVVGERFSRGVEAAIDVTLLSRFYERYADHAVSVTRRVVTIVTGEPYAGVTLKATS